MTDDIVLHLGDCMEYMRGMGDNSVDAVITDPPYGVNIADWDKTMPTQEFLYQCLRISRGLVLWFGAAPMILEFADYKPRPDRILIWSPKFTLSRVAKDGFAYRYHPIAIWNISKQNIIPWDVIDDMTECGNWWKHPATKPLTLIRKFINAWDYDKYFDPFMGSGTTGVACVQLGRKFIGSEIDPAYFAIAEKRIKEAQMQLRLEI